ncbi:hypothetical protein C0995_005032, partial [Termitomyces sp. Mi166
MGGEARKNLFLLNDHIGRDFRLFSPPLNRWVRAAIRAVKQWIETELALLNNKLGPEMTAEERMDFPDTQMTFKEQIAYVRGTFRPSLPVETEPTPMVPRVLDDYEAMAELFTACLEASDWPAPADDEPQDILPYLLAQEKAKRALELEGEEEDI